MEIPPELPLSTGSDAGSGERPPLPDHPRRTGWRRLSSRVVIGLGVLVGSAGLGIGVEGEFGSFLMASWEVVLFAVLCVLAYLGLESFSARWLSRLLGTGLLLLGLGFNLLITDAATLEVMFAPFISVTGAVVIGVTAGLGEEVAVRGILQPRLGILLSNAFFTALHAYQYGWDALTSVFLTGLCLGLIRKYTSTSVSAIVHGGFDFILVMLEVSAAPQ